MAATVASSTAAAYKTIPCAVAFLLAAFAANGGAEDGIAP